MGEIGGEDIFHMDCLEQCSSLGEKVDIRTKDHGPIPQYTRSMRSTFFEFL